MWLKIDIVHQGTARSCDKTYSRKFTVLRSSHLMNKNSRAGLACLPSVLTVSTRYSELRSIIRRRVFLLARHRDWTEEYLHEILLNLSSYLCPELMTKNPWQPGCSWSILWMGWKRRQYSSLWVSGLTLSISSVQTVNIYFDASRGPRKSLFTFLAGFRRARAGWGGGRRGAG